MPQDFVASAIIRAVRELPGYPRLRVLDLSCGRGEILSALKADGCTVRGTHYRNDDYKLTEQKGPMMIDGLPIDPDVDLMKPLPYDGGSFDVALLSEVIEHLPAHQPIIAEVGRVLVPNGVFVVSTPNLQRLHSRWHFFWSGTHKLIRRRVGWDLPADQLYAYHTNPVDFPLLHTMLYQQGMRIEALKFTRFKIQHSWLLALYPLIWLNTAIETRRRVSELHGEGERDLLRWMVHPAMLASEQLLLIARKKPV